MSEDAGSEGALARMDHVIEGETKALTAAEVEKVGNLVEDDEWLGLTMEVRRPSASPCPRALDLCFLTKPLLDFLPSGTACHRSAVRNPRADQDVGARIHRQRRVQSG